MATDDEIKCLQSFLGTNRCPGNDSENTDNVGIDNKIRALVTTLEMLENEYKHRERQRLDDLQLALNNTFASKSVLVYTKDYKKSLETATREVAKQITQTEQQIQELSSDIVVNEKRFNEFRNNVVTQAEECRWEMEELYELLQSDGLDLESEMSEQFDQSSRNNLTEFTELGRLGLQLSQFKRSIDERNAELEDIAKQFSQIRYAHAGQFHADKEAYIYYRKNADLADHELNPNKKRKKAGRRLKYQPPQLQRDHSNENIGMLIDLNEQ